MEEGSNDLHGILDRYVETSGRGDWNLESIKGTQGFCEGHLLKPRMTDMMNAKTFMIRWSSSTMKYNERLTGKEDYAPCRDKDSGSCIAGTDAYGKRGEKESTIGPLGNLSY